MFASFIICERVLMLVNELCDLGLEVGTHLDMAHVLSVLMQEAEEGHQCVPETGELQLFPFLLPHPDLAAWPELHPCLQENRRLHQRVSPASEGAGTVGWRGAELWEQQHLHTEQRELCLSIRFSEPPEPPL